MNLEPAIKEQLKSYFSTLDKAVTVVLTPSSHGQFAELKTLLQDVLEVHRFLHLKIAGEPSEQLHFSIENEEGPTDIHFYAIPGGHELSSLVLALLNAGGLGKFPDPGLISQIQALSGPIHLDSYISLSCEVCPDVVQALNLMTILNPHIRHNIIDGGLYPDKVQQMGIQAVPALYHDNKLLHSGKITLSQLLSLFQEKFGSQKTSSTSQSPQEHCDVAIIGGGPAAAAAAIYSARKGMKTIMLADKLGGQVEETKGIENLITTDYIEGKPLAHDLLERVRKHEVPIWEHRRVEAISGQEIQEIHLKGGETVTADAVIVATGAQWRELGIPGEKEYLGRGVAFCPHCDGPYFVGKKVAVIGGGNSGVEAAIDLAGLVKSVTLIEYQDSLKADQILIDKLHSLSNVDILTHVATKEIKGDGSQVVSLSYQDRASEEIRDIDLQGVFVQIGLLPNSAFIAKQVNTNPMGEIIIDEKGRTSCPGIYAAGDVTTMPYKQIITAMGEGAKTALAVFEDRMRKKAP